MKWLNPQLLKSEAAGPNPARVKDKTRENKKKHVLERLALWEIWKWPHLRLVQFPDRELPQHYHYHRKVLNGFGSQNNVQASQISISCSQKSQTNNPFFCNKLELNKVIIGVNYLIF